MRHLLNIMLLSVVILLMAQVIIMLVLLETGLVQQVFITKYGVSSLLVMLVVMELLVIAYNLSKGKIAPTYHKPYVGKWFLGFMTVVTVGLMVLFLYVATCAYAHPDRFAWSKHRAAHHP